MGAGDWLMAAGEARHIHEKTGRNVVIVDRHNRAQWIDLWNGLPYILPRYEHGAVRIVNGSGVRPYILAKLATRWKWRPYKPKPAEIRFTLDEMRFADQFRDMVMIEPNVKQIGHGNKAWLRERWFELAERLDMPLVQCVQSTQAPIQLQPKVLKVITPTFRHALAVLGASRAFIGTEGGLMHGAAAVHTPAVILWSEFISPDITGYEMHRNLRHAGVACGSRLDCSACRKSMAAITVDEVVDNLKEILCQTPA